MISSSKRFWGVCTIEGHCDGRTGSNDDDPSCVDTSRRSPSCWSGTVSSTLSSWHSQITVFSGSDATNLVFNFRNWFWANGDAHSLSSWSIVRILALIRRFPWINGRFLPFESCNRYVPNKIFWTIWYGPNHVLSNFLYSSCRTNTQSPSSNVCGLTRPSRFPFVRRTHSYNAATASWPADCKSLILSSDSTGGVSTDNALFDSPRRCDCRS